MLSQTAPNLTLHPTLAVRERIAFDEEVEIISDVRITVWCLAQWRISEH